MSTPARFAQISSCSTAAARNVSAAQISGVAPVGLQEVRQLPDRRRLAGAVDADDEDDAGSADWSRRLARRPRRPGEDRADLLLDQVAQALAASRARDLTAETMRSVAATPTSAEISSSSSASSVSTSTGRLRRSGASARRDDLLEALDELLLGAGETVTKAAEEAHRRDSIIGLRPRPAAGRSISASTAARRVVAPGEHLGHLRGDRQLDAVTRAERQRGARRLHALGDHLHRRRGSRRAVRPRPSSMPTWRLRLRAPVQVSTRSPRPVRPASVSRRPPSALRQPGDLGEAARDQAGQRVVPEAEPFDDAGGDRDHVLQRRPNLDADDVVGRVEAEEAAAELRLHQLGRAAARPTPRTPRSAARAPPRGRSSGRTARRPGAPGPSSCAMTSDGRSSVSTSRPFVALTIVARGLQVRRRRPHHAAHAVRRRRRRARGPRRRARRRSDRTARRRPAARRRAGTGGSRAPSHLRHELRFARPQAHVVPDARQVHGQRRAPAAAAEDRDVFHGKSSTSATEYPSRRSRRSQRSRRSHGQTSTKSAAGQRGVGGAARRQAALEQRHLLDRRTSRRRRVRIDARACRAAGPSGALTRPSVRCARNGRSSAFDAQPLEPRLDLVVHARQRLRALA